MDRKDIHILIDRYFNAETTLEEERDLLEALLRAENPDSKELEALAVMGYCRIAPETLSGKHGRGLRNFGIRKIAGYAAVACAAVIVCVALHGVAASGEAGQSECLAYVRGERMDDEDIVMHLLQSQLSEMSEASGEVHDEIENDINDIINAMSSEQL